MMGGRYFYGIFSGKMFSKMDGEYQINTLLREYVTKKYFLELTRMRALGIVILLEKFREAVREMFGVLVNGLTVFIGSGMGLVLKRGIPPKVTEALMTGIALCTVFIGISGALEGQNTLVLILSMATGTVIGTLLDIDRQLNRLGAWVETRFKQKNGQVTLAEGFVTASLLFCVGAMTIVGSLQAGLTGDCEMLYTKAALDLISSCVLAASLGFGVFLAGIFVLLFQGGLVLLAGVIAPFLTDYAIGEMTCAGSVLIIALGLNIMGITKIKVANYLPVILIPPVLCMFM